MRKLLETVLLKEKHILNIVIAVIYGAAVALVAGIVWIIGLQNVALATKDDFQNYKKSHQEFVKKRTDVADRRWFRMNLVLIRLQKAQGIDVPKEELNDPLLGPADPNDE